MAAKPERLLVVEDDPSVAGGLVRGLRRAGFSVELATNGRDGLERGLSEAFSLIVLDLLLPERHGFEVMQAMHARSSVPIIVLTASADLPQRLRSFELGAVDFVTKPFWIEELVARIHTRLGGERPAAHRTYEFDGLTIDFDAREARRDDALIELTRTEFNLVAYLVEHRGNAVSRDQLAEAVLDGSDAVSGRTVDSHVARARKKLGAAGRRIYTVWGVGYRFEPPVEK